MDERIARLIENWERRNIASVFCANKDEAHTRILTEIPEEATIGFSGSQTLEQLEIVEMLESRGNMVYNQYKPELSSEESLRMRRMGMQADYYLVSANAVSENGELVFFSAYGHRTAGIAAAKRVLVVCGINKLTPNLAEAVKRARHHATPLNVKRLGWDSACAKDGLCHSEACLLPEFRRMCCQLLVIEAEVDPGRVTVMLVNEDLGF